MDAPRRREVREPFARTGHPLGVRAHVTTDAELVRIARAGDGDALGVLLQRHRAELYAAALGVLRDRDAAMDAVQDTALVALTRLSGIREPEAVGRWLRTVVRNCCLMQLRREGREVAGGELDDLAGVSDVEELVDRHALRDRIWTALDDLEEDERATLVLRHFTRCRTYESIAAMTGVPVGTVRSRLNRARRRLLEALDSGTGASRDQARLEASRRTEWESFYRELQKVPEPPTYLDLYRRDVTVRDGVGRWEGLDAWSAEEREAIQIGVRATLGALVAGRDLTAIEIHFHNPPSAPAHCPPSATFVHRLRDGRTARADIYYHASAAADGSPGPSFAAPERGAVGSADAGPRAPSRSCPRG